MAFSSLFGSEAVERYDRLVKHRQSRRALLRSLRREYRGVQSDIRFARREGGPIEKLRQKLKKLHRVRRAARDGLCRAEERVNAYRRRKTQSLIKAKRRELRHLL